MTVFNPISSLKTLISNNFNFSNVNADVTGTPLDGKISVFTRHEFKSTSQSIDNGYIKINNEDGAFDKKLHPYRNENFVLSVDLVYSDDNDVLRAILSEVDRVFNNNNSDESNDQYIWEYSFDQNESENEIPLVVTIQRRWIGVEE